MAIYHFSGTVISRSQGRSAIACAAYRSAERLHDERYEKTHDYTHKQDVAYAEILTPENAPTWMSDRETLWNAVEANEKRKDAQLAREFNFALPKELTLEQNIALAKEFVSQAFVSKGMIADLCIHNDKMPDGEYQTHAHVTLTLREVTADGFGKKVREWNAKENLLTWREAWAETANRHLHLHGYDLNIDHRTLREQGIDLEPQHKIGAAVAQERLARLADHQRIARENGEKLLANPQIALDAITRQQSTFTHQDIARFVNRHTVDAEQFQAVYEAVKSCPELVYLGKDARQVERFTTQDMLTIETQMIGNAASLASCQKHGVEDKAVTTALASKQLTSEQQLAFEHLVSSGDLKCVVGYAGTGKSYLLGAAREAWERQGYQVLGATLSGIAADNLTGSSGIDSRTLASRFYYWDRGEQLLTSEDVLVIDEAGMLGSRQMHRVLEQASQQGAKIVLVGDPEQLQAIEAGAAFRAISDRTGYVELTDIRRQKEAWQKEATRELATGQTAQAIGRYDAHHHLHASDTQVAAKQNIIQLWNDARISQPSHTQIMLAYTRKDAAELNQLARQLRREQGELGADHLIATERGERTFAEQDRVYFLKNDRQLGVMNGSLGTIEAIGDKRMTIRLDDASSGSPVGPHSARRVQIHVDQYNHIDHGYAATIHKGQGVTVDRSYVLASRYFDRHVAYVALSRHRESVDIFYSREVFAQERTLMETFSRERAKDVSLDYGSSQQAFAVTRGIEAAFTEISCFNKTNEAIQIDQKQVLSERLSYERAIEQAAKAYDQMKGLRENHPSYAATSRDREHSLEPVSPKGQVKSPEMRKESSQPSPYEQSLQQAAQAYDQMKHSTLGMQSDMKRFIANYESAHPEQAKALRDSLRPPHERLALEAEAKFQLLEKSLEQLHQSDLSRRQVLEQLEKHAIALFKQPDVMQFLKTHNENLSDRINTLVKSHQQRLEKQRSLDDREL